MFYKTVIDNITLWIWTDNRATKCIVEFNSALKKTYGTGTVSVLVILYDVVISLEIISFRNMYYRLVRAKNTRV